MQPVDLARLFLLSAVWGSSYLLIRIAAPVLGVFLTMSVRVLLASVALILFGIVTQQLPNLIGRWRSYFFLGLLNNAIPFVLIAVAVVNLNASIAAILNATTPLFTAIIAAVWLGERLSWRRIAGLLLGVGGVAVLVGWSPLPLSSSVILGGIGALMAAFSYGVAAVYARHNFMNCNPAKTAAGQLISSSLLLTPIGFTTLPQNAPSINILLAVTTLALICTAFAYLLYFELIARIGATRAATVTFLIPMFSLFFGNVFLGEPVTSSLVIGLTMILLSIWLINGKSVKPEIQL